VTPWADEDQQQDVAQAVAVAERQSPTLMRPIGRPFLPSARARLGPRLIVRRMQLMLRLARPMPRFASLAQPQARLKLQMRSCVPLKRTPKRQLLLVPPTGQAPSHTMRPWQKGTEPTLPIWRARHGIRRRGSTASALARHPPNLHVPRLFVRVFPASRRGHVRPLVGLVLGRSAHGVASQ
jgi:hypothetical protein